MLEETEINQEKLVEKMLSDLDKIQSFKERNAYIAGVLASFQMQTLVMGQYMMYVHGWLTANVYRKGMHVFFDPDEFIAFQSMPTDEFRKWFGEKRQLEHEEVEQNKSRIIRI